MSEGIDDVDSGNPNCWYSDDAPNVEGSVVVRLWGMFLKNVKSPQHKCEDVVLRVVAGKVSRGEV